MVANGEEMKLTCKRNNIQINKQHETIAGNYCIR